MKNLFSKSVVKIWGLTLGELIIYLGNVEVQSYYGRQALAKFNLQNYALEEALRKRHLKINFC